MVIQRGLTNTFPKELEELVGKKFIFRFHVSNFNLTQGWNVYTVMKLSMDQKLIEKIEHKNCSSCANESDTVSDAHHGCPNKDKVYISSILNLM